MSRNLIVCGFALAALLLLTADASAFGGKRRGGAALQEMSAGDDWVCHWLAPVPDRNDSSDKLASSVPSSARRAISAQSRQDSIFPVTDAGQGLLKD